MHLTDRSAAIQWSLTIAGLLSGTASIFLSFTTDASPFWAASGLFRSTVFSHELWLSLLGVPFLASVVISAYLIRWNLTGRLSLLEQITAYLIGLSAIAVALLRMAEVIREFRHNLFETMLIVLFAGSLIAGIWLTVRNFRFGEFKNLSPIMLMQTPYLGNGILCLVGFWGDWQIGAYFTIATVIVYAAQMVWFSCLYEE